MRYILLGATGDLARKKILPALARLGNQELEIVVSSRRPWASAEYCAFAQPFLEEAGIAEAATFLEGVRYVRADFAEQATLGALADEGSEGALWHLAIEPVHYQGVIDALGRAGAFTHPSTKILIEKPFGTDAASAEALEAALTTYVSSAAIYRLDHYLGKDTVQLLLHARLGESALRELRVSIAETKDVQGRGAFYDETGVIRDVIQNHALEVLAAALAQDDMPEARLAILERLSLAGPPEESVRQGQYRGYREEPGVAESSRTPTAARIQLSYASKEGPIPVTICAGKALAEAKQELVVVTEAREQTFSLAGDGAYEWLVSEALAGDSRHFPSLGEVMAAWRLIDPVQATLPALPLTIYERGTNF